MGLKKKEKGPCKMSQKGKAVSKINNKRKTEERKKKGEKRTVALKGPLARKEKKLAYGQKGEHKR